MSEDGRKNQDRWWVSVWLSVRGDTDHLRLPSPKPHVSERQLDRPHPVTGTNQLVYDELIEAGA